MIAVEHIQNPSLWILQLCNFILIIIYVFFVTGEEMWSLGIEEISFKRYVVYLGLFFTWKVHKNMIPTYIFLYVLSELISIIIRTGDKWKGKTTSSVEHAVEQWVVMKL